MASINKRKGMPTKVAISQYWGIRLVALGKINDIEMLWGSHPEHNDGKEFSLCFSCGNPFAMRGTERAHIIAVVEGGGNGCDNIHNLCVACHHESENLTGERYWRWFMSKPFYDWHYYNAKTNASMAGFSTIEDFALAVTAQAGSNGTQKVSASLAQVVVDQMTVRNASI